MSVYESCVRQIGWFERNGYLTDENETLGDLALNLAQTIDGGAGLAQAAVANQLRQVLQEIRRAKAEDDDEFGQWTSGLAAAGLSALGDPKE